MARPTKITPEHLEPYFAGLRLGMSQERAADLAEVGHSTIGKAKALQWFAEAEKSARAECVRRRLERINAAGVGGAVLSRKTTTKTNQRTGEETVTVEESFSAPQWQADGWTLERRFPDDFAKRDAADAPRSVNFIVNGATVNPV